VGGASTVCQFRTAPRIGKELLGVTDGARESAQDWRELLLDLQNRGLAVAPELAVALAAVLVEGITPSISSALLRGDAMATGVGFLSVLVAILAVVVTRANVQRQIMMCHEKPGCGSFANRS
jgi:hypothetical protein